MAQNIAENFNHVSRLHGRQTDRRPTDRSCHKMNVITFTYSTDEHKTKKKTVSESLKSGLVMMGPKQYSQTKTKTKTKIVVG